MTIFFTLEELNFIASNISVTDPLIKIVKKFQPYVNQFQFGHLNARSVPKSIDELNYIISKLKLDAFAVSESWLSEHLPSQLFEIEGYKIFRQDRRNKRAGGVCIYVKDYLNAKLINVLKWVTRPHVIPISEIL